MGSPITSEVEAFAPLRGSKIHMKIRLTLLTLWIIGAPGLIEIALSQTPEFGRIGEAQTSEPGGEGIRAGIACSRLRSSRKSVRAWEFQRGCGFAKGHSG